MVYRIIDKDGGLLDYAQEFDEAKRKLAIYERGAAEGYCREPRIVGKDYTDRYVQVNERGEKID